MHTHLPFNFIDTVLHIGAGKSDLIDQLPPGGICDIYLTEADPDLFVRLKGKYKGNKNIKLLQAAIIGEEMEEGRSLIRYNLSRLNGLRPISDVAGLYPGLRVEGRLVVPCVSIFKMMEGFGYQLGGVNCLIMQAAGEEFELLNALYAVDMLKHFDFVLIEVGKESLYEGGKNAVQITEWMRDNGFVGENQQDVSGHDIPFLKFTVDRKKILSDFEEQRGELKAAKKALSAFEEQHSQLEKTQALAVALEAKLKAAEKALFDCEQERGQFEVAIVRAEELDAKLKATEAELRNDVRISLLTQSSIQSDLKDLQKRYRQLQFEKTAQDELLHQVTRRLKAASHYLESSADPGSGVLDALTEVAVEISDGEPDEQDE